MRFLKIPLAAICTLVLLATVYLTLSVVLLQPPRANYPVWFTLATILVVQSVLTLVATSHPRPPAWLRLLVAAGGAALAAIGAWMVRSTLTSPHFEGYALVLASMLAVQGALTLAVFARVGAWGILRR